MTVNDYITKELKRLGITHVFGMSGANIEDQFLSIEKEPKIQAITAKHESQAVAMAHGYYLSSGKLGVVIVTSGGGAFNIIPSLTESLASGWPVLAIVGQIPTQLEGHGGFQDSSGKEGSIDAHKVFSSIDPYTQKITSPMDVPLALHCAVSRSLNERAPSVILLPKDIQKMPVSQRLRPKRVGALKQDEGVDVVLKTALKRFKIQSELKRADYPPLVILGEELLFGGARECAFKLISKLNAMVAVTPDAKGLYDHYDKRFLGVVGVMGHERVLNYLKETSWCLLLGTRLPVMSAFGLVEILKDKDLVYVNTRLALAEEFSEKRHLENSKKDRITIINPLEKILKMMVTNAAAYQGDFQPPAPEREDERDFKVRKRFMKTDSLSLKGVAQFLGNYLPYDADIFVDAGNTGAALVHYLPVGGQGIFNVALGMGGMGHSFGAAIGAALHSGKRSYVMAGDGAFYMHGLEIHTAIEYDIPIVFIIFNNNAHAMCVTREEVFLGGERGNNRFKPAFIAKGLKAMFPSLSAFQVRSYRELISSLENMAKTDGPMVVSVNLDCYEMPPFLPFMTGVSKEGRKKRQGEV